MPQYRYRFVLTETIFGAIDHDEGHQRRRDKAKRRAHDYACTVLGEPKDIPGAFYQYVWTVSAASDDDVNGLCDYFDSQGFVTTTTRPYRMFTKEEAAASKKRIGEVMENAAKNKDL
jgi:hypothetical protein